MSEIVRVGWTWALVLIFSGVAVAADSGALGHVSLDGVALELSQSGETLQLSLATSPAQNLKLATLGWDNQEALRKDQPLACSIFPLQGDAAGAWVNFGLDDGIGGVRAVAVLLARPSKSASWSVAREWTADSVALGEMGFKREKQTFAVDGGRVTRTLKSVSVEGVAHKLDCGCTACSSRTSDIEETEILAWTAATGTFELEKHERWYLAQTGENLLTAVRKALGDARRVNHVAKLNPDISDGTIFKGGERVLVARDVAELKSKN